MCVCVCVYPAEMGEGVSTGEGVTGRGEVTRRTLRDQNRYKITFTRSLRSSVQLNDFTSRENIYLEE